MAEVAGIAVGVLGLAGVFGQAVQCLNMLQLARVQDHDLMILHQKLENQQARFFIWGESIGLHDPCCDSTIDERSLIACNVSKTMRLVIGLFQNGDRLNHRYGLAIEQPNTTSRMVLVDDPRPLRRVLERFAQFPSRNRQTPTVSTSGTTKWVIQDRARFIELVGHLRDLIDDLESLTKSPEALRRRTQLVAYEIESLSEQELEIVEDAGESAGNVISDSASLRLESLGRRSMRSVEGSIMSRDSLRTAPETTAGAKVTDPSISVGVRAPVKTDDVAAVRAPQLPMSPLLTLLRSLQSSISLEDQNRGREDKEYISDTRNAWPRSNSLYMNIIHEDKLQLQRFQHVALPPKMDHAKRSILRQLKFLAQCGSGPVAAAIFAPLDDPNMMVHLGAFPGPAQTPYEGGLFFLRIQFTEQLTSPTVTFITKIYHPNIDARGAICLDNPRPQSNPGFNLVSLLEAIVSLLDDPKPDDAYVLEIANTFKTDMKTYEANARRYTLEHASLAWPTEEMLARPSVTYDVASAR